MIVTLGQKLGAPEATPEHTAKDSKNIFERRFEYSSEEKSSNESSLFALNGAFCGWPGRGERLLRAKPFQGGAGAQNQVQSRAEYRCTLLSSSALSQ